MSSFSRDEVKVNRTDSGWTWNAYIDGKKVGSGFTFASEADAYERGKRCIEEHRYDNLVDSMICPFCGSDMWNGQMCPDCGNEKESSMKRAYDMDNPLEVFNINSDDGRYIYRDEDTGDRFCIDQEPDGQWSLEWDDELGGGIKEHLDSPQSAARYWYDNFGRYASKKGSNMNRYASDKKFMARDSMPSKIAYTQTVSDDGDFGLGDTFDFFGIYVEITEIDGNSLFLECVEGNDPDFPVWVESRELRQDLEDNGMWFEGGLRKRGKTSNMKRKVFISSKTKFASSIIVELSPFKLNGETAYEGSLCDGEYWFEIYKDGYGWECRVAREEPRDDEVAFGGGSNPNEALQDAIDCMVDMGVVVTASRKTASTYELARCLFKSLIRMDYPYTEYAVQVDGYTDHMLDAASDEQAIALFLKECPDAYVYDEPKDITHKWAKKKTSREIIDTEQLGEGEWSHAFDDGCSVDVFENADGEFVWEFYDQAGDMLDSERGFETPDAALDDAVSRYAKKVARHAAINKVSSDYEVEVPIEGEFCEGYVYISLYEEENNLECHVMLDCWGEGGDDAIDDYFFVSADYQPQDIALEIIGEAEFEYGDELGIDEHELGMEISKVLPDVLGKFGGVGVIADRAVPEYDADGERNGWHRIQSYGDDGRPEFGHVEFQKEYDGTKFYGWVDPYGEWELWKDMECVAHGETDYVQSSEDACDAAARQVGYKGAGRHFVAKRSLNAGAYDEWGGRDGYLRDLAFEYDVPEDVVFMLADFLGPNEDFDGLVTELEDYDDGYFASKSGSLLYGDEGWEDEIAEQIVDMLRSFDDIDVDEAASYTKEWLDERFNKAVELVRDGEYGYFASRKSADFWNPSEMEQKLMDIDNDVWDAHGWNSGNQVRENWDVYKSDIERALADCGVVRSDITRDVIDGLEDNNFHSLIKALGEIGAIAASNRSPRKTAELYDSEWWYDDGHWFNSDYGENDAEYIYQITAPYGGDFGGESADGVCELAVYEESDGTGGYPEMIYHGDFNSIGEAKAKAFELSERIDAGEDIRFASSKKATWFDYSVVTEIDPSWSGYDKSVAQGQLDTYGEIYVDSYGQPIDSEYDLMDIEQERKSASRAASISDDDFAQIVDDAYYGCIDFIEENGLSVDEDWSDIESECWAIVNTVGDYYGLTIGPDEEDELVETAMDFLKGASRKKASMYDWHEVPGGYGLYEYDNGDYIFMMQKPEYTDDPYILDVEKVRGGDTVVDSMEFFDQDELEEFIESEIASGYYASKKKAYSGLDTTVYDAINEWLMGEEDFAVEEMDKSVTCRELIERMNAGENVYDILDAGDSAVREYAFDALSEITGLDYDVFYYAWLHGDKIPVTASKKADFDSPAYKIAMPWHKNAPSLDSSEWVHVDAGDGYNEWYVWDCGQRRCIVLAHDEDVAGWAWVEYLNGYDMITTELGTIDEYTIMDLPDVGRYEEGFSSREEAFESFSDWWIENRHTASRKKASKKRAYQEVKDVEDFDYLYGQSALTWEGMSADRGNLDAIFEAFGDAGAEPKDDLRFFEISGSEMNARYGLTGSNAYPDDLTILSIPLEDFGNPSALAWWRFEYGARWFDDIVDNNARREGSRKAAAKTASDIGEWKEEYDGSKWRFSDCGPLGKLQSSVIDSYGAVTWCVYAVDPDIEIDGGFCETVESGMSLCDSVVMSIMDAGDEFLFESALRLESSWDWSRDDGYSGALTHYEGDFAFVISEPGDGFYDDGYGIQVFDTSDDEAMAYGELYDEDGPFASEEEAKSAAERMGGDIGIFM